MHRMQLERILGAKDLRAQIARIARFTQCFLEALVLSPRFAVNIVVADRNTHGIGGDRHAFDDDVRVVAQDVAILERAGLAFVRIADQILLPSVLLRHEAPFEPGREPRTPATTQRGLFHFRNHSVWRQLIAENFAQRLIAAARFVTLQVPIVAIEPGKDHRTQMPAVETRLQTHGYAPDATRPPLAGAGDALRTARRSSLIAPPVPIRTATHRAFHWS